MTKRLTNAEIDEAVQALAEAVVNDEKDQGIPALVSLVGSALKALNDIAEGLEALANIQRNKPCP
jgi:hypothetical protein